MSIVARAPGKLAVLGEYAVLDGAPALVIAVDRYCVASIERSLDSSCHLSIRGPGTSDTTVAAGTPTGIALVDLVCDLERSDAHVEPWRARLDTTAFFDAKLKLGLGSSAAALCAWAGTWNAYRGGPAVLEVGALIELHRRFQGGAGSGLDVASAYSGGAITFRLDREFVPHISSVQLPNSVAFAGIFVGSSASTPGLVARYHAWAAERPDDAAAHRRSMTAIAETGCRAAEENSCDEFLAAVAEYGRCLGMLGQAMQVEIVTAAHSEIAAIAREFGVVYKVSGAGGGDLGIALSAHRDALAAFEASIRNTGYRVID